MAGIARRHHFVPKFVLAGFTASGKRSGKLWVSDLETGRQAQWTPKAVGYQEGFHTLESESVPPDYLETEVLAKIEDRVAPTIRGILEKREIPSGRAYAELIYFLALQMVRTPQARKVAQHGVDWMNKAVLKCA